MMPFQLPCVLPDHWWASALTGRRLLSTAMVSLCEPGDRWLPKSYSCGVQRIGFSPIDRPSSQTWVYFVRSKNRVTRLPRHSPGMVTSRSYQHVPSKRYGWVSPYVERSVLAGPFWFVSVVPGRWIVSENFNGDNNPGWSPSLGSPRRNRHSPASETTRSAVRAVGGTPKTLNAPVIPHSKTQVTSCKLLIHRLDCPGIFMCVQAV